MKKLSWIAAALVVGACSSSTSTSTSEPAEAETETTGGETAQVLPEPVVGHEIVVTDDHIEFDEKIHFATGSSEILEDSFDLLDAIAQVIADNPDIRAIRVIGHTDTTGDTQGNQLLSLQRARAVVSYLAERESTADLEALGEGENQPLCTEDTPECHQMNRRVELLITARD